MAVLRATQQIYERAVGYLKRTLEVLVPVRALQDGPHVRAAIDTTTHIMQQTDLAVGLVGQELPVAVSGRTCPNFGLSDHGEVNLKFAQHTVRRHAYIHFGCPNIMSECYLDDV